MEPILEETVWIDIITSSSTGAATDADSTPTVEVFENNTSTPIMSPGVTKRTSKTGDYVVGIQCAAASGFVATRSYNVVASATVGGIAAKARVASFQVRSVYPANVLQINGTAATTYDGTAQGGSTTTITLANTASSTDNFYKGWRVYATGGTGVGNIPRQITGYVGSTKVATLSSAVGTAYDNTTQYVLDPPIPADVVAVNDTQFSGSNVPTAALTTLPVGVNVH